MKKVEDMTAMETCAYMVALDANGLLGEEERRGLYKTHCAKLKAEVAAGGVPDVSREFLDGMLREVRAKAGEKRASPGAQSKRKEETP